MLVDITPIVDAKIILASSSPRRVEILNTLLGFQAAVIPSAFPEDLDKSKYTPADYVQENARCKALEVYGKTRAANGFPPSLVIGADTVVVLDGRILEKPADDDEAIAMLRSLSGREHEVLTGVALFYGDETEPRVQRFVETTTVRFAELSAEAIRAYVASGEPFDKAGAYGYQGRAAPFVTGITGCYWNVVGFPAHRFCASLDVERLRAWTRRRLKSTEGG